METLLYAGKAGLYWLLFYLCYLLFFQRQTFFQVNRFYLIGSLMAGLLLPLISFTEYVAAPAASYGAPIEISNVNAVLVGEASRVSAKELLWGIYLLVAAFLSARLVWRILKVLLVIKRAETYSMEGFRLRLMPDDRFGSFSFFDQVVLNRSDYDSNPDILLNHELVHVRQRHSWDILLLEVLQVLFWFNPVLVFYKQSVKEVHEYLADESANDRDAYSGFLVSQALGTPTTFLSNNFFDTFLLKQRITMMYRNRNSRWALLKYVMVLPVTLATLHFTAARETSYISDNKSEHPNAPVEIIVDPVKSDTKPMADSETVNEVREENQRRIVSGVIRSNDGDFMPGVSIEAKGGYAGTTTDASGQFIFPLPEKSNAVVVRMAGFKSKEFKIVSFPVNLSIVLTFKEKQKGDIDIVLSTKPEDRVDLQPVTRKAQVNLASTDVEPDEQPVFPGGLDKMQQWLSRNMKYPGAASRANVEGTVFVGFQIDKEGGVTGPQVKRGIGFGCDEEALRLVAAMPKWTPAHKGGKPIAIDYSLPVKFELPQKKRK